MIADLDATRLARATLGWLFEPGGAWLTRMLAEHGPDDAAAILSEGVLPHDELRHELRQASSSRLPLERVWRTASDAVTAQWHQSRILIPEDPDWPAGLAEQGVARFWDPVCLWTRGPAALAPLPYSIAVVGARSSTIYGQQIASDFGYGLSDAGYTVVSSSSYGIDEAVVRTALANRGSATPIVVQACGLDRIHPNSSRRLIEQAADEALVLSAWPPGSQPHRRRVGTNQLLLAALTAGTVVVEANLRSAALDTAVHALHLGRVAMAVPGPVTSAPSAGCHQLLRRDRRVHLVTSAVEALASLTEPAKAATRS